MSDIQRTSLYLILFSVYFTVASTASKAMNVAGLNGLVTYALTCIILFPGLVGISYLIDRGYKR